MTERTRSRADGRLRAKSRHETLKRTRRPRSARLGERALCTEAVLISANICDGRTVYSPFWGTEILAEFRILAHRCRLPRPSRKCPRTCSGSSVLRTGRSIPPERQCFFSSYTGKCPKSPTIDAKIASPANSQVKKFSARTSMAGDLRRGMTHPRGRRLYAYPR